MSRKSKRRRMRQAENELHAGGHEAGDGFEFLDDRDGSPTGSAGGPTPEAATDAKSWSAAAAVVAAPTVVTAVAAPAAVGAESAVAVEVAPPAAAEPVPAVPVATLGEILSTARQELGLSIDEVSARTRIAAKMLQHLENDRFSEFAAEAYVRGFLRSYGTLLGLDVAMLTARYEALLGHRLEATPTAWEPPVETPSPAAAAPAASRRKWVVATAAVVAVAAVGIGGLLARHGTLELRPAQGLEQIENELRQSQAPAVAAPEPPSASAASATPMTPAPLPTPTEAGIPAVAASHEDTASPAPASNPRPPAAATVNSPRNPQAATTAAAPPVTDLVEESVPPAAPAAAPTPARDPAPDDGAPLVLTATARDSCTVHLQIDTDARHAQRYVFTQAGESRAWIARSSFRITARRADNLELRLNGRLVSVPGSGRTVVIDRGMLDAGADRGATPVRAGQHGARRPRSGSRTRAAGPTG